MQSGLRHLLLALLFALLAVVPVWAQVSGSLEWSWADFQSESDAGDVDASHFLQKYSVVYSTSGLFNAGRAGNWNIDLGYEWASLDTSVNSFDEKIQSDKLLYRGDMVFAPGGLPLRIHAFSYDMAQASPNRINNGRLLEPHIATDLGQAGQYVATGISMWAGIKNGSYLGQYREVLSQVPKLLIDYRETYVRNLEALNQEHNRLRDLAFVSLNKKDNWFHYRVTEYEDFEDPSDNYEERAYILGTIDHSTKRQWINLTNWIQLSVDGSLTQIVEADAVDEDLYQLNLFTKLKRRNWTASNFNTLERSVDELDKIEKRIDLPIFASGELDPRNRWHMSLIESSEEKITPGLPTWNEHLFYAAYQVESQRQSGLIVTPKGYLDAKRGSLDAEGQAVKLGLEMRTDGRRDLSTTWRGEYDVAWFSGNAENSDYLEQTLSLAVDHRPSSRMRIGGTQRLAFGTGRYTAESTEYLKPLLSTSLDTIEYTDANIDGTSWRSQTELYLELISSSRWKNRFSGEFEYMDRDGTRTDNLELEHVATYSSDRLQVDFDTFFESGDSVDVQDPVSNLDSFSTRLGLIDKIASHTTTLRFAPKQSWQTGGEASLLWGDGSKGSGGILHLEQIANYTFFASTGTRRRLFTLEQELIYEQLFGDSAGNNHPWYVEVNLASWWHPYRFLSLGARGEYRHYGETGADVLEYGLTAQVPFDKFQVAVTYEYGQADDGWEYNGKPGVTEHRWEVDVKKTF